MLHTPQTNGVGRRRRTREQTAEKQREQIAEWQRRRAEAKAQKTPLEELRIAHDEIGFEDLSQIFGPALLFEESHG
jgi:hypothetical protein